MIVEPDVEGLRALHAVLQECWTSLMAVRSAGMPDGSSTDTSFAVGEAAGVIAKAKALVGRDIDDAWKQLIQIKE
jgi:hypothetical protein